MKRLIGKPEISLPRVTALRSAQWAVGKALSRAGYEFEARRSGELELKLWRKRFRAKAARKSPQPVRRLVTVPGFGDTPMSWLGTMAALSPVLRSRFDEIVFLEFPGHMGSHGKSRCMPTADILLKTVHDALDSLKPEVVLGHSMGGWLVTEYMSLCGRRYKAATRKSGYFGPSRGILVCPHGLLAGEIQKKTWEKKLHALVTGDVAEYRRSLFVKEPIWFRVFGPELREFLTRPDTRQFLESVRDEHMLTPERLRAVRAEVFLVWGDQDALIPSVWMKDWLHGLPGSRGVVIPGAGHSVQMEKFGATVAVIAGILLGKGVKPVPDAWWAKRFAGMWKVVEA